ncbi:MAG: DUF429 domain-containing protein [Desulfovibrio sp.]
MECGRTARAPGVRGGQDQLFVGVDGCRGGWLAALLGPEGLRFELYARIAELLREVGQSNTPAWRALVDMPVGLPHAGAPTRRCDAEARKLLGARRASVFPPPCREALSAASHAEASAVNRSVTGRGLSIQSWNIAPRIRELDELLRSQPYLADKLLEAHPELCFAELLGAPARHSKKTAPGREERVEILLGLCPEAKARIVQRLEKYAGLATRDDFADALVLA